MLRKLPIGVFALYPQPCGNDKKAAYLRLHPGGFTVPDLSRNRRWALTPPFHPYRAEFLRRGGILSVALSIFFP
ncbi:hypothetical protein LBBP_02486 [Leptospira borgpetersenii serovar Ballum]|uniref:Uncharacterized protein n=1 Tax=Leptospira borgpetersenii serovar Ballum TaxID=280505 RepID=A0A0S2IST3_LEPBO|nr:hypothetical protein LBBP_02486 [Leptospira borgpetersenii serovar Ballum]